MSYRPNYLGFRTYCTFEALSHLGDHIEALRRDPTSNEAAALVRQGAREDGALAPYAAAFAERARGLFERGLREDAVNALVEAALVYEEDLSDLSTAADCYQRILEIDPGHRRALYALGLLLHDLGRWNDLVELYGRRLERSQDDGERTTLYLYMAEILSDKLANDPAAFDAVMKAARLAPQNIRIISRLEHLGEKVGALSEVAVVIGDLILNQEEPRVRAGLALRLAELHLGALGDPQRALAYFRSALLDDGGNPELLSEMKDVFRERARFRELAELLEEAAKDRRVGPHVVRLERELARIYEYELGDLKRALAALTAAIKKSPEDRELLDEVMRLGLAAGEMGQVADTFEEVCRRTQNGLLRIYLRLKLGHIYGAMLQQPEAAVRVYTEILEQDKNHREARRRLIPLFERLRDHRRLAVLLEDEARGGGNDAVDLWRRVAHLRRDELGDPEGAKFAFCRILEASPGDVEAIDAVGQPLDETDASRVTERGIPMPEKAARAIVGEPPEPVTGSHPINAAELDLSLRVGKSALDTEPLEGPTEFEGQGYGSETETEYDGPVRGIPNVLLYGEPNSGALDVDDDAIEAIRLRGQSAVTQIVTEEAAPLVLSDQSLPTVMEEAPIPELSQPEHAPLVVPAVTRVHAPPVDRPVSPKLSAEIEDGLVALQQRLQDATRTDDRRAQAEILEELIKTSEAHQQYERAFVAGVRLARLEATADRARELIRIGREARAYREMIDTFNEIAGRLDLGAQVELHLEVATIEADELGDVDAAARRLGGLHDRAPDAVSVFERRAELLERAGAYAQLSEMLLQAARRTP
jgi:tetratricopeptide (TPR) repeat protein